MAVFLDFKNAFNADSSKAGCGDGHADRGDVLLDSEGGRLTGVPA